MTFDPFGDFEQVGYLRNSMAAKDMRVIKKMEHDRFLANLPDALEFLSASKQLTYSELLTTHRMLFYPFYPWAGQDRLTTTPNKTVRKGSIVFANPEDIASTVDVALRQTSSGTVLGTLAHAHPFLDGNGRALAVFFSEYQLRHKTIVLWNRMERSPYLSALGQAILGQAQPLDALLQQHSKRVGWLGSTQTSLDILSNVNWSGRREGLDEPKSLMARLFKH